MVEQTAIQLINEEKQFSDAILPYFKSILEEKDIGQNYHVISVFGSQSSGKSTLLNILFNTEFDTMDAQVKRQQTTKGIWLAHTHEINNSHDDRSLLNEELFVLDVEGSDGAERGEDQDFERKAALFAISVSEVLIVNLWEQQIGLYQGNNMGLLKTVFEVNLSLFGNSHQKKKVLLLFVIRDHVGVTPLESLSESLINELESLWDGLNKPIGSDNISLYDFFDLKFVGLGHKILQNDKFIEDVKKLGDQFSQSPTKSEKAIFRPIYHHMLPLDGWCMYAQNCWDQIENNKDLDLPTQQILVARFKTNEILEETFIKYFNDFDKIVQPILNNRDDLILELKHIKEQCLSDYDSMASRYTKQVYLENRQSLISKINEKFENSVDQHLKDVSIELLDKINDIIKENMNNKKLTFIDSLTTVKDSMDKQYMSILKKFNENDLLLLSSVEQKCKDFEKLLDSKIIELKNNELKLLISKVRKTITFEIKDEIIPLLSNPSLDVWDKIISRFNSILDRNLSKYKVQVAAVESTESDKDNSKEEGDTQSIQYDFQLGLGQITNDTTAKRIHFAAWLSLATTTHDYLKSDTIVNIIRDTFENAFRYDENDTPILWKDEQEIDETFKMARRKALSVLDILCMAKTSDNVEIVPDVNIDDEIGKEYEDEVGIYHMTRFSHILNELEKEKVLQQFKRQVNLIVIDAKRSIIKTTTHIPLWIYVIIVVLGWNEFMMVIKNPFYVTMLLILSVAFFFVHRFNLWNPVLNVVSVAIGETRQTVKSKLREYVLDEHEKVPHKARSM
ncbi:hypothetical protein RI543_003805 [Arxiozyma heterogenica]|uniref:GB1/RHD3-type G domain-containing protein n=1 Tax=Arxiozyma heterogenica TaxID=278026 RepID=A0AAN7WLK5_9SACH|nr:hypothetical protein RI543_003805 [Kazachstania heterogenica]